MCRQTFSALPQLALWVANLVSSYLFIYFVLYLSLGTLMDTHGNINTRVLRELIAFGGGGWLQECELT